MIKRELFDTMPCGSEVYAYTLSNDSIVSARIIDFGCTVVNLWVKDKNGDVADVVCGFDNINGYLNAGGYQGAVIGRTANRITGGKFTLDGVEYTLYCNDGDNSLHGGEVGFNKRMWHVTEIDDASEPSIELTYISPDMEENYPGTMIVKVTYTLTTEGGLKLRYQATTDKTTIINMTNHSYFNLAGYNSGTIEDHIMWINADSINEIDGNIIPSGKIIDVTDTPYDFRVEKAIGKDFNSTPDMLKQGGGYDNNYIFNDYDYDQIKLNASVKDPKSGRVMKVYTNQPCVGIYTSNMIDPGDIPFKGGVAQRKWCAVCFETQKMPDSINHSNFTDTVLRPGEVYDYTTIYSFENS